MSDDAKSFDGSISARPVGCRAFLFAMIATQAMARTGISQRKGAR